MTIAHNGEESINNKLSFCLLIEPLLVVLWAQQERLLQIALLISAHQHITFIQIPLPGDLSTRNRTQPSRWNQRFRRKIFVRGSLDMDF